MHQHTTATKLSHISTLHYYKLFLRSIFLLIGIIFYFTTWHMHPNHLFHTSHILNLPNLFLILIWLFFIVEMILRFFPSKYESMGCQKQFAKNYLPIKKGKESISAKLNSWKSTLAVAIFWIVANMIFGGLYFKNIFDKGIMLLLCLFYSVCDMICILFFCPFQTWFMKNRCCVTCRIYNWDFAMMFTPFLFIPSFYTWSLLLVALLLLLYWEIMVHCHPERFMETTNACMSCKNCQEKLCAHKKQLKSFWKSRNQKRNC